MSMNLVNLNVNPCKMCMPMGSVSAFYGIKGCMTLLHGSQGCSTYIRRHMATHYNEPVDIASSSLTEEGTVFGGEKNLMKGLENLISLYHPAVIGVATTCLAETIGEDIPRMIRDFYDAHPDLNVKIIPVSSSGYSGTQYEGFFAALKAIVTFTEMKTEKHNKINIITGMISPADTRALKEMLDSLGLEYILLPDLSENLDGVHREVYERLPEGGTSIEDIAMMAGSRLSIELTSFVSETASPAKYLSDTYGVPYVRCALPVGLRATDALIKILSENGAILPDSLKAQRGRYLDAMVDSHKYNAQGRAVVFGEPDFVYAVSRLCLENGLIPVVAATGAKCEPLKAALQEEIKTVAGNWYIDKVMIADDIDFDKIEEYAVSHEANVMIGNSDGRRIEEKLHIPLIRSAFPIHDHVGGQRIRTLFYDGSLELLDRITNAILSGIEHSFRSELYDKYYQDKPEPVLHTAESVRDKNVAKTETHPCFNGCGTGNARMHLPIAPKCNIQCNYCVRKFDCPNESRPGVTTQVLNPQEACEKYLHIKEKMPNLSVVGIAGPGDALAEFEKTKETLQLIRKKDPDVTFCLSTNGLLLPQYAHDLIALGVSHVTITINAVDPAIGAKIYHHISYMGETYTGETAAAILLANQLAGLKMLAEGGVICKVNIVMLKGINEDHIPKVVQKVKSLGCEITNIMQMIPVEGSVFEHMPLTSLKEVTQMRKECGVILNQMYHCRQCRADAVGTLDNDESYKYNDCLGTKPADTEAHEDFDHTQTPMLVAVASKGGVMVDQHFGQASDFYIYECRDGKTKFKERRSVNRYCDGAEFCDGKGGGKQEGKMEKILETIDDCACVIAIRIGESPKEKLTAKGIHTLMSYGRIEEAVAQAVEELKTENGKETVL